MKQVPSIYDDTCPSLVPAELPPKVVCPVEAEEICVGLDFVWCGYLVPTNAKRNCFDDLTKLIIREMIVGSEQLYCHIVRVTADEMIDVYFLDLSNRGDILSKLDKKLSIFWCFTPANFKFIFVD